jgi:hypothetical protein
MAPNGFDDIVLMNCAVPNVAYLKPNLHRHGQ